MNTITFFENFWEEVKKTSHWLTLEQTVENSQWHREENVAVHTSMTIDAYLSGPALARSERERLITLMALLFHDFGKPEAEQTLEKKDQPGVFYHRYAGHEPISGNEFMSFMCDHVELRNLFFAQGYGWEDVRKIKFMIEHHLPYGLKKEAKRSYLRQAIGCTMGEDDNCYWDMLRSDARGRISDDHETKLDNVEEWIHEFRPLPWEPAVADPLQKTLYLLVGVSGSGKSSWLKKLIEHLPHRFLVFNEDALRLEYAHDNLDSLDQEIWPQLTLAEQYDSAWKFCHPHADSKFDTFSSEKFRRLLDTDRSIVVDCMNQGRKDRRRFIQRAKQAGYVIRSVEFFISESTAKARQQERGDKFLPPERVHLLFMQMEIPWLGSEIDGFEIIPPN